MSKGPFGGRRVRDVRRRVFYVRVVNVVALWEAFDTENKRFDLDTVRVPNRSPTPISKATHFRGQSDDIWGARGPHFRPIWVVPGVRAGLRNTYLLAL